MSVHKSLSAYIADDLQQHNMHYDLKSETNENDFWWIIVEN